MENVKRNTDYRILDLLDLYIIEIETLPRITIHGFKICFISLK